MSKWITIKQKGGREKSVNLDLLPTIEWNPEDLEIYYIGPLRDSRNEWVETFPSKKEYERKRAVIQRKQNQGKDND